MSIDGVLEAVRRLRNDIVTQAATTASGFRNTHLPAGSLSARPAAQAFLTQHNTAQGVYVDTVLAVEKELNAIADNFAAAAAEARGVDDRVAGLLRSHNPDNGVVHDRSSVDRAYLSQVNEDANVLDPGRAADQAAAARDTRSADVSGSGGFE
jgi:hypothetical protein